MHSRSRRYRLGILVLAFAGLAIAGNQCPTTDPHAMMELAQVGVNKYVGAFQPATAEDAGDWTKYTYDTDGGNGPTCIDGSPFTVFHQQRDPKKLVVFLNGGGACWQDFYFCTFQADQDPPAEAGIFADGFDTGGEFLHNPLADWSKLYVSYCDGSVHQGDNTVIDPSFPAGGVRHHRGLRNATAALDLARSLHPAAKQVLLSGSSAGGFGVSSFSHWVTRFVFPASAELRVFNDAGPPINNPSLVGDVLARANDWQFTQFYPPSCTDCDIFGDGNEFVRWTLDHDRGVRVSTYSTDGDEVIRFFLGIPTQELYRAALQTALGPIHADHPNRYKRFIRSGDTSHTSLRGDLFYTGEADGVPLYEWTGDFVNAQPGWVDIVEDFVPAP
jgi:hypothetical protein